MRIKIMLMRPFLPHLSLYFILRRVLKLWNYFRGEQKNGVHFEVIELKLLFVESSHPSIWSERLLVRTCMNTIQFQRNRYLHRIPCAATPNRNDCKFVYKTRYLGHTYAHTSATLVANSARRKIIRVFGSNRLK